MFFLLPSRFNPWGRGHGWQGKPLFQLTLLETVAKFPTASWQMPKACSAARRGQLLMRSLMQLQPGRERAWGAGGLDARLWLQLVSRWRLLNPSRQVHSTWAEGLRDPGRPGLTPSIRLGFSTEYCSQQSRKVRVQEHTGGARHYLTANCSCWLDSWARRSRPEPLSLPFPAHAASRSWPQVARR